MILVTGGTGRLGSAIVRVLRSAGLDTRCLVRKGSEYYWLNDTGTNYFFGDLRDPSSLLRAMRGVTHVVAAAGLRVERTDNNHKNVTHEGNVALFDAAKARGVGHVVFVSCAAVAAPNGVPALEAQKAAEDHLIGSGLSHTVLRPGLFAANYADLARRVEIHGNVFLPGDGRTRVAPIHTRDVALLCLAALEAPAARDRVLDVHGPDVMTSADAFAMACEAAGLPNVSWRLPSPALRAASALVRPLGRRWTNRLRALDAYFTRDVPGDGRATAAELGVPLTPFRDAVAAAWAERHPGEDPTAREEKVVHRQFVATIYEPGTVPFTSLPEGPPPRQD
jgi:uncharacterized protein YbjT (DUF2867 family)